MANFKKVVSYIFSHPHRNRFKGTFTTHSSSLQSFRKSSSILQVGCPPKTMAFHSTSKVFDPPKMYMSEKVCEPNTTAVEYTEKIKFFCESGLIYIAIDYLEEMVGKGFTPDAATYTMVIDSLLNLACTPEVGQAFALKLFRDMAFHHGILPDIDDVTYTPLLHAIRVLFISQFRYTCHSRDMISEFLKDMMKDPRVHVGVTTFNIFVDALCKEGRMKDAKSLVEAMIQRGKSPDIVTYKWIIDGYFLEDKVSKAREVFDMMMRRDVAPSVSIYNTLLNGYIKEGRMEDAESLVELMIQRGKSPDIVTYKWIIDGYCLQGNVSKARGVFDTMMRRGVIPSVDVYNTLLNGYIKDSKIEQAMSLFHEMKKDTTSSFVDIGVDQLSKANPTVPNECTYKIVLEGLCKNNQMTKAALFFNSIPMADWTLDKRIDLYNILIDGASKNDYLGMARYRYHDLTIKRLIPNAMTYAAMIHALCEKGLTWEAYGMFLLMKKKSLVPNDEIYYKLIKGFSKNNQQRDLVEMCIHELATFNTSSRTYLQYSKESGRGRGSRRRNDHWFESDDWYAFESDDESDWDALESDEEDDNDDEIDLKN